MAAGVAMLAWCALLIVEARMAQRLAREALEAARRTVPTAVDRREPLLPLPRRSNVARGTPLADLSIPRVHLSAMVLHGSDARTLRQGVGHVENTAWPGDAGNVALAGHRDSFFRPLRNVRMGDDVLLDTPEERIHYRVSSLGVVKADAVSVLAPTADATLTLITCYPFWVLGHAPDRFVVRATRVVGVGTPERETTRAGDAPIAPAASVATAIVPTRAAPRVAVTPRVIQAPTTRSAPTVLDDEAQVRDMIGRFRITYNARLASHADKRSGGPLTFAPCEVVIEGGLATATCPVRPSPLDVAEPSAWRFTLQQAGAAWAIRSIAAN